MVPGLHARLLRPVRRGEASLSGSWAVAVEANKAGGHDRCWHLEGILRTKDTYRLVRVSEVL